MSALQSILDPAGRLRTAGGLSWLGTIPRIVCADGFSLSVQTGSYLYCNPRDNQGPWTHVEVGFPSEPCPELEPYQDGDSGVLGYVPAEIVEAIIARHGGVASAASALRYWLQEQTGKADNELAEIMVPPRLICRDGFNFGAILDGERVEIDYPSGPCPEIDAYRCGETGIYSGVPVDVVESIIAQHGGSELWL